MKGTLSLSSFRPLSRISASSLHGVTRTLLLALHNWQRAKEQESFCKGTQFRCSTLACPPSGRFGASFQRGRLSVRQNIHMLDDLVERTRKYHDMTFSKLEGDNQQHVVENIDQACDLYAERAVRTVVLIRELTTRGT